MSAPKDMNFGHLTGPINGITNVETVAIFSRPVIMPYTSAHILVAGVVAVTNGAGVASLTLKIYRGVDATGVLVLTGLAASVIAAGFVVVPFAFEEDISNAAQLQYAVTVTDSVNQAGNNINFADIVVTVL